MKLKDGFFQTYNDFKLDTSKITLRSMNRKKVKLPYNGPLPEQFARASAPRLDFDIQAGQPPMISLYADTTQDNLFIRAIVEAEPEEIIEIFDKLFLDGNERKSGLDLYWTGVWSTHYMEWRRLVKEPLHLEHIISQLDEQGRNKLLGLLRRMDLIDTAALQT